MLRYENKNGYSRILTMFYKKIWIFLCCLVFTYGSALAGTSESEQQVPDQIYHQIDNLFSLINSDRGIDSTQVSALIDFVKATPEATSVSLKPRGDSKGAFYSFIIDSQFSDLLDYAFNPDIPSYLTKPSSLQNQQWKTPETEDQLRRMLTSVEPADAQILLRGADNQTITPDMNTGSYYSYDQNRLLILLQGLTGPVLISATVQDQVSEVGKRGCIVGDDKNWDYLYSDKTGLNTTGLGWIHSYMYEAFAVMVYVADSSAGTIQAGTFKWLSAGWSKINMVKSHHILGGIKRFVADLKSVLEAADLPEVEKIASKYNDLRVKDKQELRQLVSPYLEDLSSSKDAETCPSSFINSVASGDYLMKMSDQEIIRILMLEYLKHHIGEHSQNTAEMGLQADAQNS